MPDGIAIRGNGSENHKTLMITGAGQVASVIKYWTDSSPETSREKLSLLTPMDALKLSAESISLRIKPLAEILIVKAEYAYGISYRESGRQELVPAYCFICEDGSKIIVDAEFGSVLD